jgi:hypothetical protein
MTQQWRSVMTEKHESNWINGTDQYANENPGKPTEAAPSNSSSSPETPGNPNTETEPEYGNGNGALSPVRLDFPVVPPDLKDLRPTDGSAPGNERAEYRHIDLAKVYGNQ